MTSVDPSQVRLLIVDNDPIVLSVLNEQLQSEGFQVTTAASTEEGLNTIQSGGSFSVVLASHEIEGMSGLEMLSKIKELNSSTIRVLSSSGLTLTELCDAVKSGAADRFIVKPWLREELVSILMNSAALQLSESSASPVEDSGLESAAEVPHGTEEEAPSGGGAISAEGGDALVEVFTKMLSAYHPNLGNASERTMALCETMARNLSFSAEDARSFKWAGGLHAIGFIHIERGIIRRWLRSAEKCTEEEIKQINQHPKESEEMLEHWPIFKDAGEIIHSYLEQWDGTGFPDRLTGEMIPVMSRYLAPAVYFASRHQSAQQILKEMESQAEIMFDPKAIEAVAKAAPETTMPSGAREILLIELEPGMTLAQDICNSAGLCIIAKGKELSNAWINKISNINNATPLKPYTMILC